MNIKILDFTQSLENKEYTLKKKWNKNFEFLIECSYSFRRYEYSFQAYINGYLFREHAESIERAEELTRKTYLNSKNKLCKKNHKNPKNCERRGYKNGAGFCKTCNLFVCYVFPPDENCCICGEKTYWTSENLKGKEVFYCEKCCHKSKKGRIKKIVKECFCDVNIISISNQSIVEFNHSINYEEVSKVIIEKLKENGIENIEICKNHVNSLILKDKENEI